jgi:hypothetical protein
MKFKFYYIQTTGAVLQRRNRIVKNIRFLYSNPSNNIIQLCSNKGRGFDSDCQIVKFMHFAITITLISYPLSKFVDLTGEG